MTSLLLVQIAFLVIASIMLGAILAIKEKMPRWVTFFWTISAIMWCICTILANEVK